ncbi:hypothetical protein IF690_02960 [Pseudomonas sp. SK3(2021)]|nr:hypothetical protein IF690_02960 [Pseudomonas sp. SK3(2021)]
MESINVDITEINTLNQAGVENLQATNPAHLRRPGAASGAVDASGGQFPHLKSITGNRASTGRSYRRT